MNKYIKILIVLILLFFVYTIILIKTYYMQEEPYRQKISNKIKNQLDVNNGNKVDLSTVIESKFERVCIFGPYSQNASTRNILGFDWDIEEKTSIDLHDGYTVLAFIEKNQVVDYVKHPRNFGDFSSFSGKCFNHFNAKFERKNSKTGLIHLNIFTSQTNKSTQETSQ